MTKASRGDLSHLFLEPSSDVLCLSVRPGRFFKVDPKTDLSPSSCLVPSHGTYRDLRWSDALERHGASRERSGQEPASARPSREDQPARSMDLEPNSRK